MQPPPTALVFSTWNGVPVPCSIDAATAGQERSSAIAAHSRNLTSIAVKLSGGERRITLCSELVPCAGDRCTHLLGRGAADMVPRLKRTCQREHLEYVLGDQARE